MTVVIAGLKMSVESESYIDAVHAILSHKEWISYSKSMLAGMTASVFRFVVNRRLTAESHTAYNWMAENFLAADFLGVTTSQAAGFSFDATFPLYRQQAVSQIKDAIDNDTGAIIWKDRFVIAVGYDDEQEALLISNGDAAELELLAYDSFGSNASPYWYYQLLEDRISLDHLEICRESLMQAVYKWETHDPMLPEEEYACGRAAYDALITALQSGEYDHEGLRTVIRCYTAAKRDIRKYVAELETYWHEMRMAAEQYMLVETAFSEAKRLTESVDERKVLKSETIIQMIDLFVAARESEGRAIEMIKTFMSETIDIRTGDIALR